MKQSRLLLVVLLFLSVSLTLFGLGDPEAGEYEPVEGLENWDHTIDLSEYEEGKYNLIIRGTDAAGNLRYEGPYNIFVDPDSDLPRVRISNPTEGMRVGGSLNVVGVCLDDDGVEQVEIQIDEGPSRIAEGKEFWSVRVDPQGLPDGEHVLQARGIDVNGVPGERQSVRFHLDRRAPTVRITSHPSGALVSGRVQLKGTVSDANGVRELEYGRQRDGLYQPLKLVYDKSEDRYGYELQIDTEELEDGPQVFWFRAEDNTGSAAYMAFLLFVNNEEPLLEILSPQAGDTVNGKLLVAGKAFDRIGLQSLSYQIGSESGQIQLVPGNPFWTHEFDLSDRKAGALQIAFTLENLTGNRRTEDLKVRLDPEADKPVLVIAEPREGSQMPDGFTAIGYIRDEDGGKDVEYTIDGADPVTVKASDAFRFIVSGLAPGRHVMGIRATDANGIAGDEVRVQFSVVPPPPQVALTQVRIGETARGYKPGIVLPGDQKANLSGEIRGSSGSSVTAEYSFQGSEFRRLSLKKSGDPAIQLFEVPVGNELSPGRVEVWIRAADGYGGTGDFRGFVFLGGAPDSGHEILLADARIGEDGKVLLAGDQPLFAYVPGGGIKSVILDPPTDLVAARREDNLIRVEAASSGISEPLRIKVSTEDGRTLQSQSLQFITDREAPTISVSRPAVGSWFADGLTLAGRVGDPSGIRSLEYALGEGQTFTALDLADAEGNFSTAVRGPSGQEGPVLLILRATDTAGNTATETIPLLRDSSAPVLTLVAPGPEDELNGRITLVGRVEDDAKIERIEFSDSEESWEIGTGREFRYDLNLSKYETFPQSFSLKAVDAAGNEGFLVPRLNIRPEADEPVVEIQVPGDAEVIKNDFIVSGMVFDDDQVGRIFYSLDGGQYHELPGGNNFSIPIPIDSIDDNEHVVSVRAEDIGGLSSEEVSSTFMVSTSEPRSSLTEPGIGRHVRGVIDLAGQSDDPNGIAEVFVSFDNGNSYQLVEGTEQWHYRLDSTLLGDGTHAILIKAVDRTGTEGLFTTTVNIDNETPEIVLDTPSDGQVCCRTVPLDGRAIDNIGLTGLSARLIPATSVDGFEPGGMEVSLQNDGMIVESLGVESLQAGWYNLSVEAADAAGNRSQLSRNIRIQEPPEAERIELMFPPPGAETAGNFSVSGEVVSEVEAAAVLVLLDGVAVDTTEVDTLGFFSLNLGPEQVGQGSHTLEAQAQFPGGSTLVSHQRSMYYRRIGPWVQVTSHAPGTFVTGRPFLEGAAGYYVEAADSEAEQSTKAGKRQHAEHAVRKVEISFDNGGSFARADGKEQWRFRLQTQELGNGPLRILVRATFENGESAVTHTQLQVDTRAPELVLMSPAEGGRFNQEIKLRGTAKDETGLESVEISLREGDKSRYGVPEFIQGLYLDVHAMGATYADLGLGLTFFDDNVKLQVQVGQSPPGRFSGLVAGAKLLANVATVPFGYFFGPSWDFFSMAVALGANFSYFTMSGDSIAFTGEGLMMAAVVAQLEFAKFEIADWRFFNTYSLYSELQLWFISSDVEAGTAARLSFGIRLGLL